MSLTDAVKNGPRATNAKTARIEAKIREHEARARQAQDAATALRRRANGDGPLAKSRRVRADAQQVVAERHRAEANRLRTEMAKAAADRAKDRAKEVKRTVATTKDHPDLAKPDQVAHPREPVGQQARPAPAQRRNCERCGQRPWTRQYRDPHPNPLSDSIDTALGVPLRICDQCPREIAAETSAPRDPDGPREPRRMDDEPTIRSRRTSTWNRMFPQPLTDSQRRFWTERDSGYNGWLDQDGYRAPDPFTTPTKGQPMPSAISGEAVNIEQTRANLDQLKAQVTDLRGSFEGISGSLASGRLNQLAGSLASADDALDSVLTQIEAAEKHLADQEAIAEAAQAAGEMHADTSFYGA